MIRVSRRIESASKAVEYVAEAPTAIEALSALDRMSEWVAPKMAGGTITFTVQFRRDPAKAMG